MNPKDYSNYGLAQELLRLKTHSPALVLEAAERLTALASREQSPASPDAGAGAVAGLDVDELAQEIRRVDGSNSLGAGALAEALMPFLAAPASAPETPEQQGEYPPLPKPWDLQHDDDGRPHVLYTSVQMRAYVDADRAALAQAAPATGKVGAVACKRCGMLGRDKDAQDTPRCTYCGIANPAPTVQAETGEAK